MSSYYEEKRRAYTELNEVFMRWYNNGSQPLDIKRLIFELTMKHNVGELTLRKRIYVYTDSILKDTLRLDKETDTITKKEVSNATQNNI